MSNLHRGHSIDASYQVLAKGNMSFCHHLVTVVCHPFTFHILIFAYENPQPNELKLAQELPVAAMFVNGSGTKCAIFREDFL
jgi:hypothetical protein